MSLVALAAQPQLRRLKYEIALRRLFAVPVLPLLFRSLSDDVMRALQAL